MYNDYGRKSGNVLSVLKTLSWHEGMSIVREGNRGVCRAGNEVHRKDLIDVNKTKIREPSLQRCVIGEVH